MHDRLPLNPKSKVANQNPNPIKKGMKMRRDELLTSVGSSSLGIFSSWGVLFPWPIIWRSFALASWLPTVSMPPISPIPVDPIPEVEFNPLGGVTVVGWLLSSSVVSWSLLVDWLGRRFAKKRPLCRLIGNRFQKKLKSKIKSDFNF